MTSTPDTPTPGAEADPPGGSGASMHPVLRAAAEVTTAVKAVAGVDPVFMSVADKQAALVELLQARDRVDALWMRVLAASDDVALETGARDAGSWVAAQRLAEPRQMRVAERVAVALSERWRLVEESLADATVSMAQARVIVGSLDDLASGLAADDEVSAERRAELVGLAERELVRLADQHGPGDLRRLGERILAVVAPQLEEERDRRALEAAERRASAATSLRMRRRGDGSTDVFARVPDHVAARLKTYLDAYTSPRVAGDTATDPATGQRLPGHRLAGEAFASLLEALDPDRMPLHGGAATTMVVTIGLETLTSGLGEAVTGDGTRITADQARRLACTAGIVPVVLGGDSRPLDAGRRRRLFTTSQRLALALRHRCCQAEGCEVPASWCEAHHITPWSEGGPTDLANGELLCSWHHHRAHDPAYDHQRLPDGTLRFHRRT